jgi:hypothetical protein
MKMVAERGPPDPRDRKVREWLLLLLRFAVTREPSDHSAVLVMADKLDSLGGSSRQAGPTFFLRTSEAVCEAIGTAGDPHSNDVLRRHIARIDDRRLRQAFRAAIDLQEVPLPQQRGDKSLARKYPDLWRGLPKPNRA